MSHYNVSLPNYSVGTDCYHEIPSVTRRYGKTAIVIGGKTAMQKARHALLAGVEGSDTEIVDFLWFGGDSSYENGNALKVLPSVQHADMIFGVGGGRACDTAKYVADQLGKPLFTFPTLASNCAACTAISVIYGPDQAFLEYYYPTPAVHTFINTDIIADSPSKLLWAGIGDALSKEIEAMFSSSQSRLFHTTQLGRAVSGICTTPLLECGKKALDDCAAGVSSFELEQVALDIIISTGIVSNLMSSPDFYFNSSLAHCVYYGATVIPRCEQAHLHGEIVSFGVLCLLMYDGQLDEFDRIAAFNKSMGLPVCLADLDLTPDDLPAMTEKAMTSTEWKNAPAGLTPERFTQSILDADARGNKI